MERTGTRKLDSTMGWAIRTAGTMLVATVLSCGVAAITPERVLLPDQAISISSGEYRIDSGSYTTTAGKLAPMFINEGASTFTFFHEVCFNGDPFAVRVSETRGAETRTIRRGEGDTAPYVGH